MFEQVSSHDRVRDDHTKEKLSNSNGEYVCVCARACDKKKNASRVHDVTAD